MGVATGRDLARFLRRHHQGVLAFGGRVAPARYVVEGRSEGAPALIVGLEPVALSAPEHLLFVPEERADAAQVLLVPIRAPSTGDRGTDRWEGYFGPPSKLALCRAVVRGVKWRGE
ncbi:MAG TPA: hypothetical protein VD963_06065, partial [Phycisphaerales bacterium]|nr:hypothetical protein [Phycisphaerales bacterium]